MKTKSPPMKKPASPPMKRTPPAMKAAAKKKTK